MKQFKVFPGHGVGEVLIGQAQLKGNLKIRIIDSGMIIIVAKEQVRDLVSKREGLKVREIMSGSGSLQIDSNSTWATRYRTYMELIKSGSLSDVAHVYAALTVKKQMAELSFGERKMLDNAYMLLNRELSLVGV